MTYRIWATKRMSIKQLLQKVFSLPRGNKRGLHMARKPLGFSTPASGFSMKRFVLAFLIACAISSLFSIAHEFSRIANRHALQVAHAGIAEAERVIGQDGFCMKDRVGQICPNDKIYSRTVNAMAYGYEVRIYNIANQATLSRVSQVFMHQFEQMPDMHQLKLVAYNFPRDEGMQWRNIFKQPSFLLEISRRPPTLSTDVAGGVN